MNSQAAFAFNVMDGNSWIALVRSLDKARAGTALYVRRYEFGQVELLCIDRVSTVPAVRRQWIQRSRFGCNAFDNFYSDTGCSQVFETLHTFRPRDWFFSVGGIFDFFKVKSQVAESFFDNVAQCFVRFVGPDKKLFGTDNQGWVDWIRHGAILRA